MNKIKTFIDEHIIALTGAFFCIVAFIVVAMASYAKWQYDKHHINEDEPIVLLEDIWMNSVDTASLDMLPVPSEVSWGEAKSNAEKRALLLKAIKSGSALDGTEYKMHIEDDVLYMEFFEPQGQPLYILDAGVGRQYYRYFKTCGLSKVEARVMHANYALDGTRSPSKHLYKTVTFFDKDITPDELLHDWEVEESFRVRQEYNELHDCTTPNEIRKCRDEQRYRRAKEGRSYESI